MAVDEVLLRGYAREKGAPPTLRLYGWHPAAVSVGRRQPLAAGSGVEVVRRPTGGQAVLHEDERTYAVAGPLRRAPFPGGVLDTYQRIAGALVAGLRRMGLQVHAAEPLAGTARSAPFSCFDVLGAHEIAWRGRKLVGSAQVRARGGFLQHGSLPRRLDAVRLAAMLGHPVAEDRFTDLSRALGRTPSFEELDAALIEGFEEVFACTFQRDVLTDAEREAAALLAAHGHGQVPAATISGLRSPA